MAAKIPKSFQKVYLSTKTTFSAAQRPGSTNIIQKLGNSTTSNRKSLGAWESLSYGAS